MDQVNYRAIDCGQSVVDALRCAVEIQRGMVERNAEMPEVKRIEFRFGIHQGDIIIDEGDIFGDGVNVAARLEGLAEPGGICVSSRVQEDAQGKLDITFADAGEWQLKNIDRSLKVYRVRLSGEATSHRPSLPIPDRPSIAVLPFENMSGDPEQDYFADGMVDEIITALSRFRNLFVIARNSCFTYKGRAVDVKQVGRELGVRYVLEGSVRKAGNRVRITGQLIDSSTAAHLWADRFEGGLEDIFDLQDQVTASVVGAITPKLEQAEIERAKRKPTESLDAYDYYLRAMASYYLWTRDGANEALRLCYRAMELDSNFASAYGLAARCYTWHKSNGWLAGGKQHVPEAARLARRAVELGNDDAGALSAGGFALAWVAGDLDTGAAFIDQALVINPNLAPGWHFSGQVRIFLGEPDIAIDHFKQAMRLSPFDPLIGRMRAATALALFFAGRYGEASSWVERALRERPNDLSALRAATACYGIAGRLEEARKSLAHLRALDPSLCISNLADRLPLRRAKDLASLTAGLRNAGLPE